MAETSKSFASRLGNVAGVYGRKVFDTAFPGMYELIQPMASLFKSEETKEDYNKAKNQISNRSTIKDTIGLEDALDEIHQTIKLSNIVLTRIQEEVASTNRILSSMNGLSGDNETGKDNVSNTVGTVAETALATEAFNGLVIPLLSNPITWGAVATALAIAVGSVAAPYIIKEFNKYFPDLNKEFYDREDKQRELYRGMFGRKIDNDVNIEQATRKNWNDLLFNASPEAMNAGGIDEVDRNPEKTLKDAYLKHFDEQIDDIQKKIDSLVSQFKFSEYAEKDTTSVKVKLLAKQHEAELQEQINKLLEEEKELLDKRQLLLAKDYDPLSSIHVPQSKDDKTLSNNFLLNKDFDKLTSIHDNDYDPLSSIHVPRKENKKRISLLEKQIKDKIDKDESDIKLLEDFVKKMGLKGDSHSAVFEGGVPTKIDDVIVPDNLYTDEQRNNINTARQIKKEVSGMIDGATSSGGSMIAPIPTINPEMFHSYLMQHQNNENSGVSIPSATIGGMNFTGNNYNGTSQLQTQKYTGGGNSPLNQVGGKIPTGTINSNISTNKQYFLDALNKGDINDPQMRASMAAVTQEESHFIPKSETDYSHTDNSRIRSIFGPQVNDLNDSQLTQLKSNPEEFFNKVYGGRLGNASNEGYEYRGRGYFQLTGKGNYERMDKLLGMNGELIKNPDLANDPEIAAKIAVAYMKDRYTNAPGGSVFEKVSSAVGRTSNYAKGVQQQAYQNYMNSGEFAPGKEATLPISNDNTSGEQANSSAIYKTSQDVINHLQAAKQAGLITNDQCVSLTAASVGVKLGDPNGGKDSWASNWVGAGNISKDTALGTPLITTTPDNKYAGGTGGVAGIGRDHGVNLLGQHYNDKGQLEYIDVANQWKGNPYNPNNPNSFNRIYATGKGGENDALSYRLAGVNQGKGNVSLLGGVNNPEYQRRLVEQQNSNSIYNGRGELTPDKPNKLGTPMGDVNSNKEGSWIVDKSGDVVFKSKEDLQHPGFENMSGRITKEYPGGLQRGTVHYKGILDRGIKEQPTLASKPINYKGMLGRGLPSNTSSVHTREESSLLRKYEQLNHTNWVHTNQGLQNSNTSNLVNSTNQLSTIYNNVVAQSQYRDMIDRHKEQTVHHEQKMSRVLTPDEWRSRTPKQQDHRGKFNHHDSASPPGKRLEQLFKTTNSGYGRNYYSTI